MVCVPTSVKCLILFVMFHHPVTLPNSLGLTSPRFNIIVTPAGVLHEESVRATEEKGLQKSIYWYVK